MILSEEDRISILKKKLRCSLIFKSIPTIILTPKDTEFEAVTKLNAGIDDYIT